MGQLPVERKAPFLVVKEVVDIKDLEGDDGAEIVVPHDLIGRFLQSAFKF